MFTPVKLNQANVESVHNPENVLLTSGVLSVFAGPVFALELINSDQSHIRVSPFRLLYRQIRNTTWDVFSCATQPMQNPVRRPRLCNLTSRGSPFLWENKYTRTRNGISNGQNTERREPSDENTHQTPDALHSPQDRALLFSSAHEAARKITKLTRKIAVSSSSATYSALVWDIGICLGISDSVFKGFNCQGLAVTLAVGGRESISQSWVSGNVPESRLHRQK